MDLLLASGNMHKKNEFATILKQHRILTPRDIGASFSCAETGDTFAANALQKAEALYAEVKRPLIADDSGLCVDALGGAPGVRSARYGDSEAKRLNDRERYELLLAQLENEDDRRAAFVCSLVLMITPRRFFLFQESCEGRIAREAAGSGGFGYDPVFYLLDLGLSMAELAPDEKDRISHRGRAGRRLAHFLENQGDELGVV